MKEVPLSGGLVSSPVKVGSTVRRVAGPWTPAVQALLAHVRSRGFMHVPEPLGIDEQGRESLSYLPGTSAHRPWPEVLKRDDGLIQMGKMLRAYHDAVRDFVPPEGAEWRIGKAQLKPGQVIRHGDLGPWNTLWQGEQLTALLDWDFAEPGEAITDLAQAAWYFVPLRGEKSWVESGFAVRPDFLHRLEVLCEAYGGRFTPSEVLAELDLLQQADMRITERLGKAGVHPWSLFWDRDGLALLQAENAWLQEHFPLP